jgi:hypothetical protein
METRWETANAFYQLKLGHRYNKAYFFWIGKADSPNCSCRAKQTPEHLFLSCEWLNKNCRILHQDLNNILLILLLLLHTQQGIQATLAFISGTKVAICRWRLDQSIDSYN